MSALEIGIILIGAALILMICGLMVHHERESRHKSVEVLTEWIGATTKWMKSANAKIEKLEQLQKKRKKN